MMIIKEMELNIFISKLCYCCFSKMKVTFASSVFELKLDIKLLLMFFFCCPFNECPQKKKVLEFFFNSFFSSSYCSFNRGIPISESFLDLVSLDGLQIVSGFSSKVFGISMTTSSISLPLSPLKTIHLSEPLE